MCPDECGDASASTAELGDDEYDGDEAAEAARRATRCAMTFTSSPVKDVDAAAYREVLLREQELNKVCCSHTLSGA